MAEEVHGTFDPNQRWHGKGYGCVWRHASHSYDWSTNNYKLIEDRKECDYRKNGFDISKNPRSKYYNGPHKEKAEKQGYFDRSRIREAVNERSKKRRRSKSKKRERRWKQAWQRRLAGPIGLLEQDPKAWHIGHTFTGKLTPWFGIDRTPNQTAQAENFLPKPHGGWHFFFPYKHNYHHLIARGDFTNIVLNGKIPAGSSITPFLRLQIVLCKKYLHWNFNNKDNIILLPNEEIHAEIVGLPAHCPWDTTSHPDYTDMIKNKLNEVRKAIDKAVSTEDHKKAIQVSKKKIEETQKELFDDVRKLKKL